MTWEDLTCGSLFSGPGLMDYGLHLAGLKHKWFVESVEFRRRLLAVRFPDCEVHDDVRTFDAVRAPRVDVIAGGFPCRGVSTAGQRTGLAHPETALWREFARIVGDARPRYVVVENVANILTMHRGTVWGTVLGDLAALGYDAWWDCFPAAAFGAPHLRDRVFLVASLAVDSGERSQATAGLELRGPAHGRRAGTPTDATAEGRAARSSAGDEVAGRGARGEPRRPDARATADTPTNGRANGPAGWGATSGLLAATRPSADAPADAERGGLREQPEPIAGRGCAPEHRQAAQFPWGRFGPAIRRWEAIAGAVPEPFLPRVAHGRPRGVDGPRVAALGDGVLVQAARYIGELLVELDRISTSGSL